MTHDELWWAHEGNRAIRVAQLEWKDSQRRSSLSAGRGHLSITRLCRDLMVPSCSKAFRMDLAAFVLLQLDSAFGPLTSIPRKTGRRSWM